MFPRIFKRKRRRCRPVSDEETVSEDNPEFDSTPTTEEDGSSKELELTNHQSENGMVGDSKRTSSVSSPNSVSSSSGSSNRILKFDGFHLFLSDEEDKKEDSMSYKDYDVTGPSHDNPYPWTNVKAVQCDIKNTSSSQAMQTDISQDDVTVCAQCNKKLNGEKGNSWKKLFSSSRKESVPARSHSIDPKEYSKPHVSKSGGRHGRARSQPTLATPYVEDDIPEQTEVNYPIDRGIDQGFILSDNIVPSPLINRRISIEKRPTVILTSHPDDDASEISSIRSLSLDESQESLASGVSASSLDVPIPNLRIKAPLHPNKTNNSDSEGDIEPDNTITNVRKRSRRPAIAPGIPIGDGGQFLIEPSSLSTANGSDVSDGRRSLRASLCQSSSSVSILEGYMNQRFEDDISHLNQAIKHQQAQKKKLRKRPTKGKQKNRTELEEALKRYTIYDKEELEFAKYGQDGLDWVFFMKDVLQVEHIPKPNSSECKRRNKIWELFRSEVVYLVDHILILKNVFQGSLLFLISDENTFENIEPRKVFANLDEICSVSTAFCRELYKGLKETTTREIFGPTEVIVRLLENFDTKISPAYQTYCMNYDSGAVEYLKKNEEHVDFRTFLELREKECGKSRLGIKDFLAAPIQRITKYPLLLREIRDNTPDNNAKNHLMIVIENVSTAISNLEKKVKWLAKFERLKELDEMIVWPQSDPIEGKNAVTDYIRTVLNENTQLPNQMLFGSNKRNLASEGPLQMMESNKFVDIYILLFEDLLLLTRKDSKKREKKLSTAGMTTTPRQSDSIIPRSSDCNLNVHKEPIPLDRISIIDMDYDQGVDLGVKNIFALVQFSRYGQPTGVTILAAQTQLIKNQWKQIIESTKEKCIQSHKDSHDKKARKEVH
ncbi:uncharacterized protein [Apostichopus japonicus]|uniref:uncharacterized protein isoform X3 n=1 Tax=Stichopus japonicus TaxID=307972 RepID=UPI003AB57AF6